MKFRALNFDYHAEATARLERQRQQEIADGTAVKHQKFRIQAGRYERPIDAPRNVNSQQEKSRARAHALKSLARSGAAPEHDAPGFLADGFHDAMTRCSKTSILVAVDTSNGEILAPTHTGERSDSAPDALVGQRAKHVSRNVVVASTAKQMTILQIANQPWKEQLRQTLLSRSYQRTESILNDTPLDEQSSLLTSLDNESLHGGFFAPTQTDGPFGACAEHASAGQQAQLVLSKHDGSRILASVAHQMTVMRIAEQPWSEQMRLSFPSALNECEGDTLGAIPQAPFLLSTSEISKRPISKVSFSAVGPTVIQSKPYVDNEKQQASASSSILAMLPPHTAFLKNPKSLKRKSRQSHDEKAARKKERKEHKSAKREEAKKRKREEAKVPKSTAHSDENLRIDSKTNSNEENLPVINRFTVASVDNELMKARRALKSAHQVPMDPQQTSSTSKLMFRKPQLNLRGFVSTSTCQPANPTANTCGFIPSEPYQSTTSLGNTTDMPTMTLTSARAYPAPQTETLLHRTLPIMSHTSSIPREDASREFQYHRQATGQSNHDKAATAHTVQQPTDQVTTNKATDLNEPIQLLCSESFLETWGECVSELASGRWAHLESSGSAGGEQAQGKLSNGRKICLVDTPLVNICRVDMEAPNRCGLLVIAAEHLESVDKAKEIVHDVTELAAIGRYKELFVFICCGAIIAPSTTKHLIQLHCAVAWADETKVMLNTVTKRSLSMSLAHTILSRQEMLPNVKLLEEATIQAVADRLTSDRAQFLLWLLPSLSANGAVQCILLSKHLLPPESPYFQLLFKNKPLRQQITLITTSKGSDIHPTAMTQLALVATVNFDTPIDS